MNQRDDITKGDRADWEYISFMNRILLTWNIRREHLFKILCIINSC